MKFKSKKSVIIAVIVLFCAAFGIYLLFVAYIPDFIDMFDETTDEISERTASKGCPEVVFTDYDKEFLDKLLNDPRILALDNSEEHNSVTLNADEDGLERYAPRANENYTVYAHNRGFGEQPLDIGIQFRYEGGLYKKNLYISAYRDEGVIKYVKSVQVKRSDGKFIKDYWYWHGKYRKTTQRYGLINHIKIFISGIMSV